MAQKVVLVAEGQEDYRQYLEKVLNDKEVFIFTVLTASSVKETKRILDEKQPDICLFGMFWNQDPEGGFGIAKYIKDNKLRTLPIVMTVDPFVLKFVKRLGLFAIQKDLPSKDFAAELKRIVDQTITA